MIQRDTTELWFKRGSHFLLTEFPEFLPEPLTWPNFTTSSKLEFEFFFSIME